ncbi:hypothetical protein CKM354_001210900 [Cercospora kikuchii]|uniref:NACHT domain-containing protein n=1 Tax=Cercospora kikuchii TaxID=84275 RepID=A0A9P3CU90_9PEZI|nr:uncharacterized protein CKM354_001210900 [Cercospora kikuchii]GIZ49069.1 hypothetical protein CKM354_001210900 [Cercospora kikuchii]
MASGLEVLGAAAAVAQFTQLGIELSKNAIQVYGSIHGTNERTQSLYDATRKFRDQHAVVSRHSQSLAHSSDKMEQVIVKTMEQIQATAVDLLKLIDGLRAKDPKRLDKVFTAVVKTKYHESDIEKLRTKLDDLRRQLAEQSVQLISVRVTSDIPNSLSSMEQTLLRGLTKAKDDLSSAIKLDQTAKVPQMLSNMCGMMSDVNRQIEILRSLKYEEIRDRWGRIQDPHGKTYSWVFEATPADTPTFPYSDRMQSWLASQPRLTPVNFLDWLENGNGIYWITGKPGCGKSTLMKYITDHSKTQAELKKWAGQTPLVTAMHYFWFLGTPIQRSYEGLLQSLLWNILRQCPEIIQHTCRARWDDQALALTRWQLPELRDSMSRLTADHLTKTGKTLRFCFFIDGIDEYDGDHEQILRFLLELSRADNIKICASSRPWEVFKNAFADTVTRANSFELHHYTRHDIVMVIDSELEPYRTRWPMYDAVLDELMQEIADKAKGVFLWVTLVIKQELKVGLEGRDSIEELRERLRNIPEGLLPYLEHIFKKLPKGYKRDAARLFMVCMRSTSPLPTPAVEIIKTSNPHALALQNPVASTSDWDAPDHIEEVRAQINTRCRDLMSVEPASTPLGGCVPDMHAVEFLHRSVRDFLEQPVVHQELVRLAGKGFCAQSTLFAVYVSLIKKLSVARAFKKDRSSVYDCAQTWAMLALLHESHSATATVHLKLLEQLDEAMGTLTKTIDKFQRHWTNWANSKPRWGTGEKHEEVLENNQRDLLGHLIELGLVAYADTILKKTSGIMNRKQGRPYLDYALRYSKQRWPYSEADEESSSLFKGPQASVVKMLLNHGAKVNEKIYTDNDRMLLDLYLDFVTNDTNKNKHKDHMPILRLLIEHGAYCILVNDRDLNDKVRAASDGFGVWAGDALIAAIRANAKKYERGWIQFFKLW